MPPHGIQTQGAHTDNGRVNIDMCIEENQLNKFSEFCRIFFTNAISTGIHSGFADLESGGSHIKHDDELIKTCKAVLEAFNSICTSRRPVHYENEAYRAAVTQCGLSVSCFAEGEDGMARIGAYIKVRDKERMMAHVRQMRARKEHFLSLLREKEEEHYNQILSHEADLCSKMKRWDREGKLKGVTREFVRTYKKKIGAHSFLAGFRTFFETQYRNKTKMVVWSFDYATLTENCSTGDDAIIHDALALLVSLLQRQSSGQCEEEKKDCDESVLCWALQDYVSMGLMRRILNVLPRQEDLDARPTGTVYVTDRQRVVDKDLSAAALDNFCIVL